MPRAPLTESLPNIPALETVRSSRTATQLTTLPNGLRVVTQSSNSPVASIGAFVDAGSRYETRESAGISHFLEIMALKSTSNRSDFRLVREMLKMGVSLQASASREHFLYTADALKDFVPAVVGTLGDLMQNNVFHLEELMEEKEIYEERYSEREGATEQLMMEAVHEAAYLNNTLGNPLWAPKWNLPSFTPETLKSYQSQFFTPKRMVIAGVGVEHSDFVQLVQSSFSQLPADSIDTKNRQKAEYTGGEVRVNQKGESPVAHVALAFQTASWNDADLVPMCVLQILMGGGGSFTAGGPGKGMYSRLYLNILNRYDWAESVNCFNSIFSDSGLFGIHGVASADKGKQLVEALAKEFVKMTGPIEASELSRAKNQLKANVYYQLEQRTLRLEDIGRQVQTYGKVKTPEEISALIDSVSAQDLQRVATKMISQPLTVAAMGDTTLVPRYDLIQKLFK